MTYEEWLAWPDGDGKQSEWIDGEVIAFMPPSVLQARLLGFLHSLLAWYVEALGLGEVLQAPVEMRLQPGRSSREPDLLFVAERHRARIGKQRIDGAADLVVELISDDSVTRDRVEKLAEYQAAGIPEYWLLDPRPGHHTAQFFQHTDGLYRPIEPDADGRYRSAIVRGFWFRPAWLWQEPLPTRRACLLEIAPETLGPGMAAASGGEGTPSA
jgi:Uma2 family endonuclease